MKTRDIILREGAVAVSIEAEGDDVVLRFACRSTLFATVLVDDMKERLATGSIIITLKGGKDGSR